MDRSSNFCYPSSEAVGRGGGIINGGIQLLMVMAIFALLGGGKISVVHAFMSPDFEEGKSDGTAQAFNDFNNNNPSFNNSCPGGSTSYCSGYSAAYKSEWTELKQEQEQQPTELGVPTK